MGATLLGPALWARRDEGGRLKSVPFVMSTTVTGNAARGRTITPANET